MKHHMAVCAKPFAPKVISRELPCAYLATGTAASLATGTAASLATGTPCLVTFPGIMEVYVGTMTFRPATFTKDPATR